MFCAANFYLTDTSLNYLSQNKLLTNCYSWLIEFANKKFTTYSLSQYNLKEKNYKIQRFNSNITKSFKLKTKKEC